MFFPIAKSTEVLFVNKTLFARFSEATGVTMDSLSTFEGIKEAAEIYYEWSGGKEFYTSDSWFIIPWLEWNNYRMIL
jgi:multiple sugar transport system substrate-binding protein